MCNNVVSLLMHILSAWPGNIMGPFAPLAANPIAAVRRPSHAFGANALRAITRWLGVSATARGRVGVPTHRKSRLLDKDAMFKLGDELLCRGRGSNQPLSVVVFELRDLPELHCVFGPQAARDAIVQTAGKLQRLAANTGIAGRTSATTFTVLLSGVDRDGALKGIRAALGESGCIELVAGGEDIVLVPEVRVMTVFDGSACLSEIHESLCREIAEIRLMEERRAKYLELERESHSRPMKFRALPVKRHATRASPGKIPHLDYPPMAATMPVPMGSR